MNTYTITFVDRTTGQVGTEVVHADTSELASAQVAARGVTVLQSTSAGTGLNRELAFFKPRVKLQDLSVFSRLFSTMMASGIPLLRAVGIMIDQTENPTLRSTLREVESDIEGGSSLSEAFAAHDEVFPPLMVAMVRAGELGGFLDEALIQLADSLEKDVKLRGKIKSAMTYPVVVLCMAVVGVVVMLIFIIPTMAGMFTDMGGELPLPTRMVMWLSDFFKVAGLPLLVLVIAASFVWSKYKNKPAVREFIDPLKLKIPIFGELNRRIALGRFTRNFGVMLASGVRVLDALEVVGETSNNTVVNEAVKDSIEHIKAGKALHENLADNDVIPDMVAQMVAVGEEAGTTPDMLLKLADFYEADVETRTEALSSTMEPLLIAGLAVVLGGMIVAMYLPTFMIFDLIE